MTVITRPSVRSMVNWTSSIGLADGIGAVVEHVHVDRRRQLRLEHRQQFLDAIGDLHVFVPGWR